MKDYKTTADIPVSDKIIDQIVGQDRAVGIVRKAARQRRNILLIGTPGTGKSMLAQGMAELMPTEDLEDILVYPNEIDENNPEVRVVKTYPPNEKGKETEKGKSDGKDKTKVGQQLPPGKEAQQAQEKAGQGPGRIGQGRRILNEARMRLRMRGGGQGNGSLILMMVLVFVLMALSFSGLLQGEMMWVVAAAVLGIFILASSWGLASQISRRTGSFELTEPKLIVDNSGNDMAPFIDATGSKAGALFGDVKHDPLQSFMPDSRVYLASNGRGIPTTFASLWKQMQLKYPERVKKDESDYEYIELPKEEKIYALTMQDETLAPTRILSLNRRIYSGKVVSLATDSTTITTTPEHRIVTEKGGNEISHISEGENIYSI